MTEKLTPIETAYAGVLFRSRTEARWAVYFDALGIRWEYEAEGFNLPSGERYLPDFWLPDFLMFAEVKPGTFTKEEETKAAALDYPCIMLDGAPECRPHFVAGAYCRDHGGWRGRWPIHPVHVINCECWAVCLADHKKKDAAPASLRFYVVDSCVGAQARDTCGSSRCESAANAAKRKRFWR